MTKILTIIQARMGSTRLPNKVLMDLAGKSNLERVVERVQKSQYITDIVVATTMCEHDLPIVKLCAENNIRVFCGSENDVLDRYYQCARLLNPEHVVRITADCPMIDPEIIDKVISAHLESGADYTSNTLNPTYPDGLDVEIMKYSVLKDAWMHADKLSQREHVTQYIIHNDSYQKTSVECEFDYGSDRWTLDTPNDYEFIRSVYESLYLEKPDFSMQDVMDYLNKFPALRDINSGSKRNEGLEISLKNDESVELVDRLEEMK